MELINNHILFSFLCFKKIKKIKGKWEVYKLQGEKISHKICKWKRFFFVKSIISHQLHLQILMQIFFFNRDPSPPPFFLSAKTARENMLRYALNSSLLIKENMAYPSYLI